MKTTNLDFKFNTMISVKSYQNKPNGKEISDMTFREETLSVKELAEKCINGYSWSAVFRAKQGEIKTKKNKWGGEYSVKAYENGGLQKTFQDFNHWISSNTVCVDVDDTKYSDPLSYSMTLSRIPTFVYPSYSDGIEKNGKVSRRFHLVYVFSDPLSPEEFTDIAKEISKEVEEKTGEKLEDKCGERPCQYFNGCYGKKYNISGIVYSKDNFINSSNNNNTNNINTTSTQICVKNNTTKRPQEEIDNFCNGLDKGFLKDLKELDWKDLDRYWGYRLKKIYEGTTISGKEDYYRIPCPDYFKLPFTKIGLKDGEGRRKKVYMRMCLLRVLSPEIDINTLIFNARMYVNYAVDNSDNVFDADYYVRNAKAAGELTIDAIEEKYSDTLDYLRSKAPKVIVKKENIGKIQKAHFLEMNDDFDPFLNNKENAELLGVSESTIKRFKKQNNIKSSDSKKMLDEEMMKEYDSSLSLRKNLDNLKNKGYKVSLGKLSKLVNELSNTNNINNTTNTDKDILYTTTSTDFELKMNTNDNTDFSPIPNLDFDIETVKVEKIEEPVIKENNNYTYNGFFSPFLPDTNFDIEKIDINKYNGKE